MSLTKPAPSGGSLLVLLDVGTPDLDDCLRAASEALAGQDLPPAYMEALRASLRRHGDTGPEVLESTVAVVHERVRGAEGPPVKVLIRTAEPLLLEDDQGRPIRFLWVLLSNARTHPGIGTAAEFVRLMRDPEFRQQALEASDAEALYATYARALDDDLHFEHIPPELRATGRLFGGMIEDLKRRLPWWMDDFRAGLNMKVVASILFMYFACLAPAVAFGGLMSTLTDGQIGAVETILASAVCGVLWSVIAGQPLAIIGATGPNVIFTGILYAMCVRYDVPFLPTVAWTGLWAGLFMFLLAAADASALIRYFTRFTDEIFAALISLIFIAEATADLTGAFSDPDTADDSALLSLLLALGTFAIAITLSRFRRTPYLRARVREFLSDFGPAIALAAMSMLAFTMGRVELETLAVPMTFSPTMERSWFVNPLDAPRWVWLASALPAMLLTILVWVNQNITARLASSPDNKLTKGPAYHWDIAVVGGLVGLMGMFGLPWVVGAAVRSLNHVRSLRITEDDRIVGVVENRVSNLGIHLLIGLSLLFLPLLRHVPMSVLFGLFLFMGIGSLGGNQFMERLRLWFVDPELYPPTHYVRAVPTRVIHAFTAVQLTCLAVLWVVKASTIGILFPFFIAMLVPVRVVLGRTFQAEHLALLDGEELPSHEEYREVA